MDPAKIKETDLYAPLKARLEKLGLTVKGEVGAADLVAVHPGDPDDPIIVEMKTGFSLQLFHQAIARQAVTDNVYIAVPTGKGRRWQGALRSNKSLCRRLGLGLITVRLSDGHCQVHFDPGPYAPRKSKAKKNRLLSEFVRRSGDPNLGGTAKSMLMTAYRQDATRLAVYLFELGASKGSEIAAETGIKTATRIMADNHYGWFERIERGIYGLTEAGAQAAREGVKQDPRD